MMKALAFLQGLMLVVLGPLAYFGVVSWNLVFAPTWFVVSLAVSFWFFVVVIFRTLMSWMS